MQIIFSGPLVSLDSVGVSLTGAGARGRDMNRLNIIESAIFVFFMCFLLPEDLHSYFIEMTQFPCRHNSLYHRKSAVYRFHAIHNQ